MSGRDFLKPRRPVTHEYIRNMIYADAATLTTETTPNANVCKYAIYERSVYERSVYVESSPGRLAPNSPPDFTARARAALPSQLQLSALACLTPAVEACGTPWEVFSVQDLS